MNHDEKIVLGKKKTSFQSPGELKLTVSWYHWEKESIKLSDPSVSQMLSALSL